MLEPGVQDALVVGPGLREPKRQGLGEEANALETGVSLRLRRGQVLDDTVRVDDEHTAPGWHLDRELEAVADVWDHRQELVARDVVDVRQLDPVTLAQEPEVDVVQELHAFAHAHRLVYDLGGPVGIDHHDTIGLTGDHVDEAVRLTRGNPVDARTVHDGIEIAQLDPGVLAPGCTELLGHLLRQEANGRRVGQAGHDLRLDAVRQVLLGEDPGREHVDHREDHEDAPEGATLEIELDLRFRAPVARWLNPHAR